MHFIRLYCYGRRRHECIGIARKKTNNNKKHQTKRIKFVDSCGFLQLNPLINWPVNNSLFFTQSETKRRNKMKLTLEQREQKKNSDQLKGIISSICFLPTNTFHLIWRFKTKLALNRAKKKAQWITDTHHWLTEHSGEGEKNVNKFVARNNTRKNRNSQFLSVSVEGLYCCELRMWLTTRRIQTKPWNEIEWSTAKTTREKKNNSSNNDNNKSVKMRPIRKDPYGRKKWRKK